MITENKITQELDNPSKKDKLDISINETKPNLRLTQPIYKTSPEYVMGTNDKTREPDDYPSDTDGCARNVYNEHKNEEDDDYIDPPY